MIEGSGEHTMDGETKTTRTDAAPPLREAQRSSPNRDNAGRNSPTHGQRATVKTATVKPVVDGRSNPRLDRTGHTPTSA
jgi:hypothetical protein